MIIEPVAHFRSPLTSKFGIPRQSGLAPELPGTVVFTPDYRREEAVRGLDGFDYLWLVWEFSAVSPAPACDAAAAPSRGGVPLTVRPPRLGGNERTGVFASRSPFRPNRLGLSCVRLDRVELTAHEGPVVHVLGADLMDGTPIYDVKPYVAYADAHPTARCGFVDEREWAPLRVEIPPRCAHLFTPPLLAALRQVLAQDPRPRYHADPQRLYGMPFDGRDVRFRVEQGVLTVVEVGTTTGSECR